MHAGVQGAQPERVVGGEEFKGASINIIADAGNGALWLGTDDGLDMYAPGNSPTHIDVARRDSRLAGARNVSTILKDRRGQLWVRTNEGIAVLGPLVNGQPSTVRHIGHAEGLDDLNIDALLEDDAGRIWASTDDGIAVIDPIRVLHAVTRTTPIAWSASTELGVRSTALIALRAIQTCRQAATSCKSRLPTDTMAGLSDLS